MFGEFLKRVFLLDGGALTTRGGDAVRELKTVEELDAFLSETAEKPALLFKHSTRCGISAAASGRLSKYLDSAPDTDPEMVMVKVVESRPVSNAVAEKLGVHHQSPQLILVQNGKAVWSTSHGGISGDAIAKALEEFAA